MRTAILRPEPHGERCEAEQSTHPGARRNDGSRPPQLNGAKEAPDQGRRDARAAVPPRAGESCAVAGKCARFSKPGTPWLRISAIVDARFKLIVDGVSA